MILTVGANLGLLRGLVLDHNELVLPRALFVLPAALITFAMQPALWLAVRGTGRFRWFCLGFAASAALWPAFFACAYYVPGVGITKTWLGRYLRWAMEWASPVYSLVTQFTENNFALVSVAAVIAFLPQFAMSAGVGLLVGGLLRPLWISIMQLG